MAKYECCGLMYADSNQLTTHMRKDHSVDQFNVALACCGTTFAKSEQLSDHMKTVHHIEMGVEV